MDCEKNNIITNSQQVWAYVIDKVTKALKLNKQRDSKKKR